MRPHQRILRTLRRAAQMFESERDESSKHVKATWNFSFTVQKDDLDGGWVAWSPELPGCWTQAEKLDELDANMEDAVRMWLLARVDADLGLDAGPGEDTPEPLVAVL